MSAECRTAYRIIESASGDDLGRIELEANTPPEDVLELLVRGDYLEGDAEEYELDDAGIWVEEGEMVVNQVDTGEPVLVLEPEEGPDDDDDDDDELDEEPLEEDELEELEEDDD